MLEWEICVCEHAPQPFVNAHVAGVPEPDSHFLTHDRNFATSGCTEGAMLIPRRAFAMATLWFY